jgi:hypothetical protein
LGRDRVIRALCDSCAAVVISELATVIDVLVALVVEVIAPEEGRVTIDSCVEISAIKFLNNIIV